MKAFHNDPAIKAKYLARVQAHAQADEIIHGVYWQDGKGCALGCTVHSSMHSAYETELGIPQAIARLEDVIFEGLENGEAKRFPDQFLRAIPVGADLSGVPALFLLALQKRNYARLKKQKTASRGVLESIKKTIRVLSDWSKNELDASAAASAERAAWSAESAAWSAASAAWSAAWGVWTPARRAEYLWQRNELLSLLKAA